MRSMTLSRSNLPLEVILAWLVCGLENHPARKIEPILDTLMYSNSKANISATRFLGSFVSTDKGTNRIRSQSNCLMF